MPRISSRNPTGSIPDLDETTAFARAVLANEIIACHLVKKACERHLRDLELGAERGLVWSAEAAQFRIGFYPRFLKHSKGEWARKSFDLAPWQKFITGSVFGWKRTDGTRRFRSVWQEVPRKNGKSSQLAGVGLDMLVCDGELGGEVYCAATKKEQARIIFEEAKRMVASSPALSAEIARFKLNLSIDATASKFEPLSSDERTLDGLNPHCVLIDEIHAHKTRALLDVMDTAVGARRQPLIWIITTAGDDNPASVYASEHSYAVDILEGVLTNDSVFAFISTIDKDDRWDDEAAWARANPNLGISVKIDDLRRQAEKAKGSPAALNAFKRLRLNIRTSDINKPIPAEEWAKNSSGRWDVDRLGKFDAEGKRIAKAVCTGGLDLSSKIDITAWVKLFEPDDNGIMKVTARFWMPSDTIDARSDRDKAHYRQWVGEHWIFATPGNVIDHEEIYETIIADSEQFDIQGIAFDPWSQSQLGIRLNEKGIPAFEFIQGLRSYTEPTKELQALVFAHKIDHGGNPVLAWMCNNMAVQRDKNLNEMPHKAHSTGRIDGMTALIMAIGMRMRGDEIPSRSPWEDEAFRIGVSDGPS